MLDSLLPALAIFLLRVVDVSMGTVRIILMIQGRRFLSSAIGFVEVSVFITAVASVVSAPLDPLRILAYGGGFAAGTWLGVTVDRKMALGDVIVRIISRSFRPLVKDLTASGFGVTILEGRGGRGSEVGLVFSVCRRREMQQMMRSIRRIDADAIVTVQEIRQQYHGYFAPKRPALAAVRPVEDTRV